MARAAECGLCAASLAEQDLEKAAAAARAAELVEPGMLVGLGSGTTATLFLERLGRLVASGLEITGVATSREVHRRALELGIPIVEEIDRPIDLAVDGADEVDLALNLVKGRGGALVREKLVAAAARRFVVIADQTKLVDRLGVGVIPVEVVPFLWRQTAARLVELGMRWTLRGGQAAPFVTDNGNHILDLRLPSPTADPATTATALKQVTGVVDHGLFVGMANACLVGSPDGVRVLGTL